jgi:hypothetical protein
MSGYFKLRSQTISFSVIFLQFTISLSAYGGQQLPCLFNKHISKIDDHISQIESNLNKEPCKTIISKSDDAEKKG